MSFEQVGIPVGYGFKQLLFSPVANTLVLQTCSASDNWRPERLYFRQIDWDQYRAIEVANDLISQESPFIHPSKPLLAFVSVQHQFAVDGEGRELHSGNWHSLQILNVATGAEVQSVNESNLRLPVGAKRGWVCEIVAFGDSGLFVKAAMSKGDHSFEYFIAELDTSMSLKPLATLPAVFM